MSTKMTRHSTVFAAGVAALIFSFSLIGRATVPDVPTGTWLSAPDFGAIPVGAASTVLPDGRLVVAGGSSAGKLGAGVAIYDPASETWQSAGRLALARSGHTATALEDGHVLIAGGSTSEGVTSLLEIYDPATGVSSAVGAMALARVNHAAAALKDGRVLIVGGAESSGGASLALAEVYDPATGTGSMLAQSMRFSRAKHTATTLLDGHVLIVGGSNFNALGQLQDLPSAEIYDPELNIFYETEWMTAPRSGHLAMLLPHSNTVLIAGGSSNGNALASAEQYAHWSQTFLRYGADMSAARVGAIGVPTSKAGVVLIGGGGAPTAEYYGFATVKTDKDDYAPGETVTITGSGWGSGQTVQLKISEDADSHYDFLYEAVADEFGNIENKQFYPREDEIFHHIGMRFYLTATADATQTAPAAEAQTTFTDGNLQYTPSDQSLTIAAGSSGSFSQDITAPRDLTATVQIAGGGSNALPASWVSTSPTSLIFTAAGTKTWNVTVTVPAGTPAGTYTGKVKADASVTGNPGVGPGSGTDLTVTVSSAAATTTNGSNATATYGDASVTLSATVTSNSTVNTGTVTFAVKQGTTTIGSPKTSGTVSGGNASVSYSLPAGTAAGSYSIEAVYNAGTGFSGSSDASPATLTINKATPTVTWSDPAAITYGTALSGTQLNATFTHTVAGAVGAVSGTATYAPGAGTVLTAGNGQALKVTFAPADPTNYNAPAETTVHINVLKATPTVTWSDPAAITYGTALSGTQLNATFTHTVAGVVGAVSGTATYAPGAGTVLTAGNGQALKVTFAPADPTNYNAPAETTVHINVLKATPTVTWSNPADIIYGTALSAAQLNASASVSGAFTYAPLLGTVLNVGRNQALTVHFVPTDTNNYTTPSDTTVYINVRYGWNGFLQPINDTAHQTGLTQSKFKLGQTIPAKFVITNAAGTVVQQTSNPTFARSQYLGGCDFATTSETVDSVSPDPGLQYAWDGSQYHYNWSTKGLTSGRYRIFANLADGTSPWVDICLTK
jgi:hypothetical protein